MIPPSAAFSPTLAYKPTIRFNIIRSKPSVPLAIPEQNDYTIIQIWTACAMIPSPTTAAQTPLLAIITDAKRGPDIASCAIFLDAIIAELAMCAG